MRGSTNSYLITLTILAVGAGVAWFIINLASISTVSKIGGSEADYSQLQQSILK